LHLLPSDQTGRLEEETVPVSIVIREMTVQDYAEVLALWQTSEGVGLSDADSEEGVARYLHRNPGLSFVARDGEHLVGAVLCGHDGRRGYIHHLAVGESHRRQGLGRALVERCLSALRRDGIDKCHIFVFADNRDTVAFWKRIGWTQRVELIMMSQYTSSLP
jgi:ribosomal protein S18 acetylase RimI-like enzyme